MKTKTENPLQALLAQCELQAARDMVNRWDSVPDGADLAVKEAASTGDCPPAMPMWSTVWDSSNGPNLAPLLRPMGPPRFEDMPADAGAALARPDSIEPIGPNRAHSDALQKWAADYGLAEVARAAIAELDEFADGETVDGMHDPIAEELEERWLYSGDDNAELHRSGWQAVADTGILARDFGGSLYLGVNGAGYDFYADHWLPLYRALNLDWHVSAFRTERELAMAAAVSALVDLHAAEESKHRAAWSAWSPANAQEMSRAVLALARVHNARVNYGPLAAWETEP